MMLATARRNLSPFVPYLASSLNVDVQVIAIAIASQRFIQIVTLPITPYLWNVFASCGGTKNTEKKNSLVLGKARVMVFAVVFLVLCLVIIAYGQNLYLILIFIGMSGAAKAWFDPSGLSLQRDVLRDATSRLRGVAAAGTEFNWGLASLVGVPISGLLLSISFTLPFLVLAVATTIMLVPLTYVLYHTIKQENQHGEETNTETNKETHTAVNNTAVNNTAVNNTAANNTANHPNSNNNTAATPSSCLTKVCLVCCSVPTLSNMFDAMFSALFMSNKDMVFGLWLNQTHSYTQFNIARVSTIFGGADLTGEIMLVLLLAKGAHPLIISKVNTCLLILAGICFAVFAPTSDVNGLIVMFFISMFNEIKAVATLTLGALNNEQGLEGLAETSTYLGQAFGFTIGVLCAPWVWKDGGKEFGLGVWFGCVGGLCLMNHVWLFVWELKWKKMKTLNDDDDESGVIEVMEVKVEDNTIIA